MKIRLGPVELAIWGVLAVIGGAVAGCFDLSATDVQGPALVIMLVAFALTLPGRAPVWLVAIAATAGLLLMHVVGARGNGDGLNVGMALVLVPTFIGAGGGRLAGRLLGNAATQVAVYDAATVTRAQFNGPLSTRVLLSAALVGSAVIGVPLVIGALRTAGHPLAAWLGLVWQIMSLLGWIGCTPLVLRTRPSVGQGVGARAFAIYLLLLVALAAVHAIAIVSITGMLFIPLTPGWSALTRSAFMVFLPLDALVYLAILTLAHASDVERHRRDAEQRETALRAESLDSRLAALRARLNPHFLFNALNGVSVLAASGKARESGELVQGLTALLRYVLDERRTHVPVREELEFARQYLAVQQARFGDRLRFTVESSVAADGAMVPQLVLQPLVENAVEHGVSRALEGGSVAVRVSVAGQRLHIVVDDDGPGPDPSGSPAGIGLSSTRERLVRLYGDAAQLTLGRSAQGSTRVQVELPFESESEHE